MLPTLRWLPAALLIAGCTQFPEVEARISPEADSAPPPELVPVSQILVQTTPAAPVDQEETEEELNARAAALRSKASRLRQQ